MPHLFPPTRFQSRLRAAGYLFVSGTGFYTLFGPAYDFYLGVGTIHGWVAVIWAIFMLTAVPTAISVLRGRYRTEFVMIPLFGGALLVAAINRIFTIVGEGDHDLIPRTCILLGLLCFLTVRASQLHQITKADLWTSTPKP